MNRDIARKVADAVLYEGHILYPYRPSAIKNRQRWTFGILYPADYPEVSRGTERRAMHSEFLMEVAPDARLQIELRFLHLTARQVARALEDSEDRFEPVPSLKIDDRLVESWDEVTARSVEFEIPLSATSADKFLFSSPGTSRYELLHTSNDQLAGKLTYTQQEVMGSISVSFEEISCGVLKLYIEVVNDTAPAADSNDRNAALLRSMLSTHLILSTSKAQFVSLLDPPDALRMAVSACNNIGNFPVLVGEAPERDMLLCSPIVLYDYPQIAPESANDYFDATEMDEMLTLRIMTLSDEEKSEMRMADEHTRLLLERTEQNAREQLMRTHGVIRSMRPLSEKP